MSWFDRRGEVGRGFARRLIWNAVHDLPAKRYLGPTVRLQFGLVEWWVEARSGDARGRLRYLELRVGGLRESPDAGWA
jgi:hypothetical protein